MEKVKKKKLRRLRIKRSIRRKISGNAERPRLSVYRSNKEIYAQIIDDVSGKTLASASSLESELKGNEKRIEMAGKVGKAIAEKAKEASIHTVTFDRNGFLYHGRVAALANAAREAGLKF